MRSTLWLVVTLSIFGLISGQQTAGQSAPMPDDCLVSCMLSMPKNSTDSMKMMHMQKQQVGNTTTMCPVAVDQSTFEKQCQPALAQFNCLDKCNDSPIKQMLMGALKIMKFLCVDRKDDVKKNMPCLAQNCPTVQAACAPTCGSIDEQAKKITDFMNRVQMGGQGGPSPIGGTGGTGGQDVNMNQIMSFIGDMCTTLSCYQTCSQDPVTKACGKDAYTFQRDLIWVTFQGMTQSMSSMGTKSPWPASCSDLANAAAGNNTSISRLGTGLAQNGTTVAPLQISTTPKGNGGSTSAIISSLSMFVVIVALITRP